MGSKQQRLRVLRVEPLLHKARPEHPGGTKLRHFKVEAHPHAEKKRQSGSHLCTVVVMSRKRVRNTLANYVAHNQEVCHTHSHERVLQLAHTGVTNDVQPTYRLPMRCNPSQTNWRRCSSTQASIFAHLVHVQSGVHCDFKVLEPVGDGESQL